MNQDDWFDEDENAFEIPSEKKRHKKPARRRRPEPDDWDSGEAWDSELSDPPY